MNIFSGLLAGMNFFHLIFPWANIFLVPSSPHKFSNDPSLSSHDPLWLSARATGLRSKVPLLLGVPGFFPQSHLCHWLKDQ